MALEAPVTSVPLWDEEEVLSSCFSKAFWCSVVVVGGAEDASADDDSFLSLSMAAGVPEAVSTLLRMEVVLPGACRCC